MVAAGLGYGLNLLLEPDVLQRWGWRIPFAIGRLIVPVIFLLRRNLKEMEDSAKRKVHLTLKQTLSLLWVNWNIVFSGMLIVALSNAAFLINLVVKAC